MKSRSSMTLSARLRVLPFFVAALALAGCQTLPPSSDPARMAMNAAIQNEAPGSHFFGRRMYKKDYKMWGWIREPGKPWKTARLVMMNEQRKLAPDRAGGTIGTDNNYDYRLEGFFSGETVYEPASDRFYPEFVLTSYELLSTNPPLIYQSPKQLDPQIRLLQPPVD